MSGKGKNIIEQAMKTIDWDGMVKLLVIDVALKEFKTLCNTYEEVKHTLDTKFNQEPQPIDWEQCRKGLGSHIFDMDKQLYDSIEIPKYVDKVTPQYKPKFDALLKEAKEAE